MAKPILSFTPCEIGMNGSQGWIVRYRGRILALLQDVGDGEVLMVAGFEHPFDSVWARTWPTLAGAKEEFGRFAAAFSRGTKPEMLESAGITLSGFEASR
jgi:hypothetical protein